MNAPYLWFPILNVSPLKGLPKGRVPPIYLGWQLLIEWGGREVLIREEERESVRTAF